MKNRCSIIEFDKFLYNLKLVEDDMLFGVYVLLPTFNDPDVKKHFIKAELASFLRREFPTSGITDLAHPNQGKTVTLKHKVFRK